jgi:hypothetical protein
VCILGGFYVIDTKLQLRGRPFVGSQKGLTTKMATANESLMGAKLEGAGKNKNTGLRQQDLLCLFLSLY